MLTPLVIGHSLEPVPPAKMMPFTAGRLAILPGAEPPHGALRLLPALVLEKKPEALVDSHAPDSAEGVSWRLRKFSGK